ncbi:MAG: sensor domain-containing diguanylate cyclase [Comamonas sp.]|nr:sensor domain-containing diguanylate cyclase [Comamonas sp.]
MAPLLSKLSETLSCAQSQEELVRPLLEMLQQVAQLESTYLTRIDLEQDLQQVLYACNTQQMQIPEGLSVQWSDTLCKRALSEGRMCTMNVQECWADSQAAQALGIRTYVSAPVRLSDGVVYGTLCAASGNEASLPPGTEAILQLFAKLIGQHVEREILVRQLQERNAQLTHLALTDPLTQLPNRAALLDELQRLLSRAQRSNGCVLVAFVDLDGFKQVNDTYGHAVGDELLRTVAQRLQDSLRSGDMVARMGGDEFVMVTPGPDQDIPQTLQAVACRLRTASACDIALANDKLLHYSGASIGLAHVPGTCSLDDALQQADSAMYADKQRRRMSGVAPQCPR